MALVDSHVHIHGAFDVATMLDHASAHRESIALGHGLSPALPGVLMLTESQGVEAFVRLAEKPGRHLGRWCVHRTGEPISLHFEADDAAPLVLIAGRQIVTAERLEMLALGTLEKFADGQPIGSVIEQIHEAGALAVVPWGFGKWTGARGRIVRGLLNSPGASRLFVGDNGGRLNIGPEPALFTVAREQGVPILPGSDPFPFPAQVKRPLGYGFALAADVTGDTPAAAIKQELQARRAQPAVFGRRTDLVRFVRSQLAMQWHKRRATARPAR
jgi:hypothetical protein